MQKLALGSYQLTTTEGCRVTINAQGTGWLVIAAIDTKGVAVADGVPIIITPAMLDGHMSYHRLNLHLFFTDGSSKTASYSVKIADDAGTTFDTIVRTPDPAQGLPSDSQLSITLWVVA